MAKPLREFYFCTPSCLGFESLYLRDFSIEISFTKGSFVTMKDFIGSILFIMSISSSINIFEVLLSRSIFEKLQI